MLRKHADLYGKQWDQYLHGLQEYSTQGYCGKALLSAVLAMTVAIS